MKNLFFEDLQTFGEGGDGGAGAASAGTAAGGTGAGVTAPAAGVQNQPQAKRQGEAQPQTQAAAAQTERSPDEEFEELISGKYKDAFQKRTNGIVGKRIKGANAAIASMQKDLDRANGLLRSFGAMRYGLEFQDGTVDYDTFDGKLKADRDLLSEAATRAGLSDDAYLERERYKAENAALKAQRTEEARRAFYERTRQQAEAARGIYPDLDLDKEMENPAFATMIRNGFSVQNAYESTHFDEILAARQEEAAKAAAERLSATVQANGARPAENGLRRQAASTGPMDPSPKNWTKEYREKIRREARAGKYPRID